MEDYPANGYLHTETERVSASARYQRITDNNHIITDFWTDIDSETDFAERHNLNKATRKKSNKRQSGLMECRWRLLPYLKETPSEINRRDTGGNYKPNPVPA